GCQSLHAAAPPEDRSRPQKGDTRRHRLDRADRIGPLATLLALAPLIKGVEDFEGQNGEERSRDRNQDMGAQSRSQKMLLALEPDDRAENTRQHKPDGDNVLGEIGIDQAETIADFHEPHRGKDFSQAQLCPAAPVPSTSVLPPGQRPGGDAARGSTYPSLICSLTSLGRASTARSNALIESSNAKVSEISGLRSTLPEAISAMARSY